MSQTTNAYRDADYTRTYVFPDGYDLTGYAAEVVIYDALGGEALLTITGLATGNGSVVIVDDTSISWTIKAADINSLPEGEDAETPANLSFDVFFATSGERKKRDGGPFRVWPFGSKIKNQSETFNLSIGSDVFNLSLSGGERGAPGRDGYYPFYATAAVLQAAVVPPTSNRIYLNGYYTENDGSAHYRQRVPFGSNITRDMLSSADGAYWRVSYDQPIHLGVFGAKGDSDQSGTGSQDHSNDDSNAIEDNITWGVNSGRPFVVKNQRGRWHKVTRQINFTQATTPFTIAGDGPLHGGFCPTPFGGDQALFNFDCNTDETRPALRILLLDFAVKRTVSVVDHPIVFRAPFASRLTFQRVDVSSIGNTALWASGAFNATFLDCNWVSTGWQPMRKSIPSTDGSGTAVTVAVTNGDTLVTASADIYAASDVGEIHYIGSSGDDDGTLDTAADRIATYIGPRQVRLAHPLRHSGTTRRCSFDAIVGSVSMDTPNTIRVNGGDFATLNTSGQYSYLGHNLYIAGPGYHEDIHFTTITAISPVGDGTFDLTFADAAHFAVTSVEVWVAPAVVIIAYERSASSSRPVNDLNLYGVNLENYQGPALLVHRGAHFSCDGLKCHGRVASSVNNFGQSRQHVVISSFNRFVLGRLEAEYGCHGLASGLVLLLGNPTLGTSATITSMTINRMQCAGWIAEVRSSGAESFLQIGNINCVHDFSEDDAREGSIWRGRILCSNVTVRDRVYLKGRVSGINPDADMMLQPERGRVLVGHGESFKFAPDDTAGLIAINAPLHSTYGGLFYWRTTSSPNASVVAAASDIVAAAGDPTTSPGTANKVNLRATQGYLWLENLTAGDLNLQWQLLADRPG